MKMHEPIGNSLYGPLLIRCSIGAWFVLAGLMKLDNPSLFVQQVERMNIIPAPFSTLYGILLPYLELGVGALLVLGVFTTLGAILASVLLLSFVFAFGIFPSGGALFNKDILILAAALSLLYSGAGAFSIDRFRKSG